MKKAKYLIAITISVIFIYSGCKKDDSWLTVCNHCSSNSPWSVWNLDLSNPCFNTKTQCEEWAEVNVPGNDWKCEECDD